MVFKNNVVLTWGRFTDWNIDKACIEQVLSEDELLRCMRIRIDDAQRCALYSRYFLRMLLAESLGQDPEALVFSYSEHGKPSVAGIEFNVSHSAKIWACATTKKSTIGFDIEKISPFSSGVAERFFCKKELAYLEEGDKALRFARIWAGKEAAIKYQGGRVLDGIKRYHIDFKTQHHAVVGDGRSQMHLEYIEVDPEYVACLCVQEPVQVSLEQLEMSK